MPKTWPDYQETTSDGRILVTYWKGDDYREACLTCALFTEGLSSESSEYERGQIELIADLYPHLEKPVGDRAVEVEADVKRVWGETRFPECSCCTEHKPGAPGAGGSPWICDECADECADTKC